MLSYCGSHIRKKGACYTLRNEIWYGKTGYQQPVIKNYPPRLNSQGAKGSSPE